jgi:hypothetical protein
LFLGVACQVKRTAFRVLEVELRTLGLVAFTYVQAFGFPAFALT